MKLNVFAIYDPKAQAYLQPFFYETIGTFERSLVSLVNDPKHNFSIYAEDFTLFEIGTWDNCSCKYDLLASPHSICGFHQLKRLQSINGVQSLNGVETN